MERVVQQKGYTLIQKQKPVSFEFELDPAWIPEKEGETEYRVPLGRLHNTDIYLDKVIVRSNSVYIGLDAVPQLNAYSGEFLHIWDIRDKGTSSMHDPIEEWLFYDSQGAALNQLYLNHGSGEGPGLLFGLDFEKKHMDLLRQGMRIKYSGFILYEYRQK